MVGGHALAKLLNRPLLSRMGSHVGVENAARAELHHHEDMNHSTPERSCDGEVAGQESSGVIANERRPAFGWFMRLAPSSSWIAWGKVFSDCGCSDPEAEVSGSFSADLADFPVGILTRELLNDRDGLFRERRTTHASRAKPECAQR
jgi:hypothetical protein